jgi:hypothetical protein
MDLQHMSQLELCGVVLLCGAAFYAAKIGLKLLSFLLEFLFTPGPAKVVVDLLPVRIKIDYWLHDH